jgi:hypothetical protein
MVLSSDSERALKDILGPKGEEEPYYSKILGELTRRSREAGFEFLSEAKEDWEVSIFVRPGRRIFFGVEEKTKNHAILGIIVVPDPKREYSDLAWNRIEKPLKEKLLNFETNGHKGEKLSCVFLQVWEANKRCILIPYKQLTRVKRFGDTGDFRVKRDGAEFFLETPRGEDNIKLSSHLDDLFRLVTV